MPVYGNSLAVDSVCQLHHNLEAVDPLVGEVKEFPVSPAWRWQDESVDRKKMQFSI